MYQLYGENPCPFGGLSDAVGTLGKDKRALFLPIEVSRAILMNILGIGTTELVLILIIMLVVAGPKRMMQWAYVAGLYLAKLRNMWAETSRYLQQEFDAAGVDIKVPEEIPTRQSLNRSITKALDPISRPIQESLNEVDADAKRVRSAASTTPKPRPVAPEPAEPANGQNGSMGAWSQARGSNGQNPDNGGTSSGGGEFGAWGGAGKTDE